MSDTKKRLSNFECLRIWAMIMIIFSHLMGQTGAIENTLGLNQYFAIMSGSSSRIGVSLFVMIGSWFMINREMKASRILKVWSEVLFYTVIITICLNLFDFNVTKLQLISCFFPFLRRPLWFAGAWIALMLLSPFLNEIFDWEKRKQARLIITLTIVVAVVSTTSKFMDTFLCNVFGFVYLYVLIGYYKIHLHSKDGFTKYKKQMFLVSWLIYLIYVTIKWYSITVADSNLLFEYIYKILTQYLSDFKSLPNLFISCTTFYYFANLNLGSNKVINKMAESTFAVYIIHQTPAFINVLWNDIFKVSLWINSKYFILFSILTVFLIYGGGSLIDTLRIRLVERRWINSLIFIKLSDKLGEVLEMEQER